MESRTVRPVVTDAEVAELARNLTSPMCRAPQRARYAREIDAQIAAYMVEGLRSRIGAARACKCPACKAQLATFTTWCFDFDADTRYRIGADPGAQTEAN